MLEIKLKIKKWIDSFIVWEKATPFFKQALIIWMIIFSILVGYAIRTNTQAISSNKNIINQINKNTKQLEDQQKQISKHGKINREEIARSDLSLCKSIYGQFVTLEKESEQQANFAFYKKFFPTLSDKTINELVRDSIKQAKKIEKRFDPEKCKDLPSQHLLPLNEQGK